MSYDLSNGVFEDIRAGCGHEPFTDLLNNAMFMALYRYRKHCEAIDDFVGSHATVRAALATLEARLTEMNDPYEAVSNPPRAR